MKKYIRIIFSISFGGLLIWLLFRDTDWKSLFETIKNVKINWLILAQVFAWSTYFSRVQRWSYVVRAIHPVTFRSLFSATQIGFLVNFTLPARLGEMVRAYVLARLSNLPISQCIAMVTLDRVNDLLCLLLVIFIALFSFPSEQNMELAGNVLKNTEPFLISKALIQKAATSVMIFVCIIFVVLILLYLNHTMIFRIFLIFMDPLSRKLTDRLQVLFSNIAAGMQIFRSKAKMLKSIGFSLLTWALSVLNIVAILNAFDKDFPWFTPFLMIAMIAIFISIPLVPGVVGQYHIPIIACLLLATPEIKLVEIKAIAIIIHVLSMIPIAALGIISLYREKLRFLDFILR